MAAAAPSTRSSQEPASEECDDCEVMDALGHAAQSLAGGDALDLLAELGGHLGAADALGGGGLYPLLHDRLGFFLHAFHELGRGLVDPDPKLPHLLDAGCVGGVPGLAGELRQRLARCRADGVLVLLRKLAPL